MNRPVPEMYPGDPCWTVMHEFVRCDYCGQTDTKKLSWHIEHSRVTVVTIERDREDGDGPPWERPWANTCTVSYAAENGAFGNRVHRTREGAQAAMDAANKEAADGDASADAGR